MKKYYLSTLITLFTFLVLPICVFAEVNSGFIPGQIWYSKEALIEGDTVNIHTAVWNGEKDSISAKVEFYDKSVILGTRDIILASLELKDVFISWKVTAGDHIISAKIISSLKTISGKKEQVVLSRNTTSSDKQFVAVVVKNAEGKTVSSTDALKTQIENTGAEINNLLPKDVSTAVSSSFDVVDNFRDNTFTEVTVIKDQTQKEIDQMNNAEKATTKTDASKSNIKDATKKPIAYIKIFLFTILSFILGNKIIFYGVLLLIVFFILRFIYRKIRNR